jgi:hypothetical protein
MTRLIIVGLMAGTVTLPVAVAAAYALGAGTVAVAKRLSRALVFRRASAVSRRNVGAGAAAVTREVSSRCIDEVTLYTQGEQDAMSNSSAVLISGFVQAAAAPTDAARQRAVMLCEQAAVVLKMSESDIAACKRAAAAQVAA